MKNFDVYPLYPIEPVKGCGSYVYDKEGREYLDLYGGHAVISIGHAHPHYVKAVSEQVGRLGFYSNSVENSLQGRLAELLGKASGYEDYSLFLCNSGAEANENALKLASFHTGKSKVLAFGKAFHGRTSGAVAATDNPKIVAPFNRTENVVFAPLNDLDEIQSGYGRTGRFFAHQYSGIRPDIITTAKGMGNGFPIGGVLISPEIKPWHGMLGTTFGGNHLACAAAIAVLEVMEAEHLVENAAAVGEYLLAELRKIPASKDVRGRGLMIGFDVEGSGAEMRRRLLFEKGIFTGGAGVSTVRLLPSLAITRDHADKFLNALKELTL